MMILVAKIELEQDFQTAMVWKPVLAQGERKLDKCRQHAVDTADVDRKELQREGVKSLKHLCNVLEEADIHNGNGLFPTEVMFGEYERTSWTARFPHSLDAYYVPKDIDPMKSDVTSGVAYGAVQWAKNTPGITLDSRVRKWQRSTTVALMPKSRTGRLLPEANSLMGAEAQDRAALPEYMLRSKPLKTATDRR